MAAALPVYLLVDVSSSMAPLLPVLQQNLRSVIDRLASHVIISQTAQVAIISFSDKARVELPLTPLASASRMPALEARGETSYSAAFSLASDIISTDIERLKQASWQVYRPIVIFTTDGQPSDPTDAWHMALQQLRTLSITIVTLGIGDGVDPKLLAFIATRPDLALVTTLSESSGDHMAEALSHVLETLLTSVSSSIESSETTAPVPLPSTVVAVPDFGDASRKDLKIG